MAYIGKTPASAALTSGDISDGIITTSKIADDAATADKIANAVNTSIAANTAKTTNATHSGEVTGSGALTIADNVVDEANLKVSNSPTNGYFLAAQSGNTGGLTWQEAGGGGKVLQVVSVMNNPSSNVNSNSSSYTATGLEAAITPSASNSKILILCHSTQQISGGTGTQTIYRGSTQLASGGGSGTLSMAGMEQSGVHYPMMINFLDSPNTTSATTYKLMQLASSNNTIYYNPSTVNSAVMTLMEIGA
tara:strand:+ start:28 stop:774 length:747 start_codon:yes stop_codon:yes gene_type:complete